MVDRLSPSALAAFTDKDSRQPRFRELYESNDFLTAYAKHTDLRVADDPRGAVGRSDEWESHGDRQLAFLVRQGLRPEHTLLDVGCGTGRGARKFVPYLNDGNYTGVDISIGALEYAQQLSVVEGWESKHPTFLLNGDLNLDGTFDYLWAHSVANHLPDEQVKLMIRYATKIMKLSSRFLLTYKMADYTSRTGLKQWKRPPEVFERIAKSYGLKAEADSTMWPAKQRTMVLSKSYSSL